MGIRLLLAILVSLAVHGWLLQKNILASLPAISLRSFPFSMELSIVTSRMAAPIQIEEKPFQKIPIVPQEPREKMPSPLPAPQKLETPSVATPGSIPSPREQGTPQARPLPGQPPPAYPLVAQYRHLEGTVTLEVEVLGDGTCGRVRVKKSSGSKLLDEAAVTGVKRWRFEPARREGNPVSTYIEVPVVFTLRSSGNENSKTW